MGHKPLPPSEAVLDRWDPCLLYTGYLDFHERVSLLLLLFSIWSFYFLLWRRSSSNIQTFSRGKWSICSWRLGMSLVKEVSSFAPILKPLRRTIFIQRRYAWWVRTWILKCVFFWIQILPWAHFRCVHFGLFYFIYDMQLAVKTNSLLSETLGPDMSQNLEVVDMDSTWIMCNNFSRSVAICAFAKKHINSHCQWNKKMYK